mgnify:CR=1 FL=1
MEQVQSVVPAMYASAAHATGLTATGLTDLLLAVDLEASAGTQSKRKVILDSLCVLPITEGNKILR